MENIIVLIIAIVIATICTINENKKRSEHNQILIANKQAQQHTSKVEVQELKFFCIKDKGYHVSVWPKDVYQPDFIEFEIVGITHHADVAMKHLR